MKWMRHEDHGMMPVSDWPTEDVCLRNGWTYCDAPVKAVAQPAPVMLPVEEEPALEPAAELSIEHLRAEAEALGINVDGRWGVERLRREIEDNESL